MRQTVRSATPLSIMPENRPPPGYEKTARQLATANVEADAAEVHGMLCGLLCSGEENIKKQWFDELFEFAEDVDLPTEQLRLSLQQHFNRVKSDIEGPGVGFTPLLPNDDQPLQHRASALGDWCQGFLYGLGLAGVSENRFSEATKDVLRDFSEITRMDLTVMEATEENEEAYNELCEFVWVAAMLVYHEITQSSGAR